VQRVLLIAVAVLVGLAACQQSEPTLPSTMSVPKGASHEMMDCKLTEAQCNMILAGIYTLQASTNLTCRGIGDRAYNRYMAPAFEGMGFAPGTASDTKHFPLCR